jgi:hypothetical protein
VDSLRVVMRARYIGWRDKRVRELSLCWLLGCIVSLLGGLAGCQGRCLWIRGHSWHHGRKLEWDVARSAEELGCVACWRDFEKPSRMRKGIRSPARRCGRPSHESVQSATRAHSDPRRPCLLELDVGTARTCGQCCESGTCSTDSSWCSSEERYVGDWKAPMRSGGSA